MSVILISGTIGAGKSSLTDMLAKRLILNHFMKMSKITKYCRSFIQILSSTLFYCKSSFEQAIFSNEKCFSER